VPSRVLAEPEVRPLLGAVLEANDQLPARVSPAPIRLPAIPVLVEQRVVAERAAAGR
jgi:hypothetical protein